MLMLIGFTLLLFLVALNKTRIQPRVIQKNGRCGLVKHELLVDISSQHTSCWFSVQLSLAGFGPSVENFWHIFPENGMDKIALAACFGTEIVDV